nr:uncharacterized protein LOC109155665 [Ipomoea batatas]GMD38354.1 uncharacterized protein LOC109155665 [Ipomoea batatas]
MEAQNDEHIETILNLFDSFWFEHEILTLTSSNSQETIVEEPAAAKFCRTPTLMVRSLSEQCLSSKERLESETHSPKSVLSGSPKLHPVLSGKEYLEFPKSNVRNDTVSSGFSRRRKTRSLSELEFEEVKGFMDLGFVFSDEDKDSTLGSIIPGLQRLGVREGGEDDDKGGAMVSRPYLSEAWSVMEEQRKPLMKIWRIPAFGSSEMEIKDQLRCWAHKVASNVVI